jgi:hypothetical protein
MSIFLMFVIELGVGQTDRAASSEFWKQVHRKRYE